MHKTHWLTRPWSDFDLRPACGQSNVPATENPADVTCLNCQKALENDLKTDQDRAEEEGGRKARQRARSKAVSELIARHQDEFDALWDAWAVEFHDEAVQAAVGRIRRTRAWDESMRESKRAELLDQLAALGEEP